MQIINVSVAKAKFRDKHQNSPTVPVKTEFPDFPESGNPGDVM